MHLINMIGNYLYRKYGVTRHYFLENLTRGIGHLNILLHDTIFSQGINIRAGQILPKMIFFS